MYVARLGILVAQGVQHGAWGFIFQALERCAVPSHYAFS
jgi:hypothetical protein